MIIFLSDTTFFDTNQIVFGIFDKDCLRLNMSNGESVVLTKAKAEVLFKRLQWLAAKDEEIAKANIPVK